MVSGFPVAEMYPKGGIIIILKYFFAEKKLRKKLPF
jgi:hypothetical protein